MNHKHKSCGFWEIFVFVAALVGGTACSLTSKVLLTMKGTGMTGEVEDFSFPVFQTFGMFLGMFAALGLHFIVKAWKIPFPGYEHAEDAAKIPSWMYMLLVIPSIFDLVATCLCMFGLRHVDVSTYQMLRGSAIIFVAILKHFALKSPLERFKWVGVFWNVVSVVVVGWAALLNKEAQEASGAPDVHGDTSVSGFVQKPMVGILLILAGAFVQSLQYVFEEKVMSVSTEVDMPPIPPLLLIGMEGLWGTLLCLFVIYPVAYYAPGIDHGSFENPYNTYVMFMSSPTIQHVFTIYFFSILAYNMLAVLVTYMLDSVWHAILDNFRPITVWASDLYIFYYITTQLGEEWTQWSYLQLMGMAVLLYGTALYNAPNPGSILLTGDLASCMIDCTDEYAKIERATQQTDDEESRLMPSSMMSPMLATPSVNNRQKERRMQIAIEREEGGRGRGAGAGRGGVQMNTYGAVNQQ